MGEEGGHYYDNYTFTTILKDVSGSTSIIYKYEENYTPLASGDSIYHTTTDLSNIRFHNQIMGISGEIITHTKGKNVDVLLNEYINGENTSEEVSTNISNYPFIGNYSIQTIQDVPGVKVFDLFKYSPNNYKFVPIDGNNTTYTGVYKMSNTVYEYYSPGGDSVQLVYTDDKWILSEQNGTDPDTFMPIFVSTNKFYLPPIGVDYKYGQIYNYTYPETNINNGIMNKGGYGNPSDIAVELVLPTLP